MSVRRVNQPMPANVRTDHAGHPVHIAWHVPGGATRGGEVEHVMDVWYVDDAWWTAHPVRRIYHECQLATGARIIAVRDLVTGSWFAQR